jgi:hypothetical protein
MNKTTKKRNNYYIIISYKEIEKLTWSSGRNVCPANLAYLLREELNDSSIDTELSLIWNDEHRQIILKKYEVDYFTLEDYTKSSSKMLSFQSDENRQKAIEYLKAKGVENIYSCNSYRDMIIAKAHFYNNNKFPSDTNDN